MFTGTVVKVQSGTSPCRIIQTQKFITRHSEKSVHSRTTLNFEEANSWLKKVWFLNCSVLLSELFFCKCLYPYSLHAKYISLWPCHQTVYMIWLQSIIKNKILFIWSTRYIIGTIAQKQNLSSNIKQCMLIKCAIYPCQV